MIKYDLKTIEFLKKLSTINPTLSLEIIEDSLVLFSKDITGDVLFTFKTLKENFDFGKDRIHFLNFPDFYNAFKNLSTKKGTPSLELKEEDDLLYIEMSIDQSTMGIALASEELVNNEDSGANDLSEVEVYATLDWKSERDKRFKNMINTIARGTSNEGTIDITCDGTNVVLSILNNRQNNSFKETLGFDLDTLKPFSYRFKKDIFLAIPDGDYVINIYGKDSQGFLEMELQTEEGDPTKLTFQTYNMAN